MNHTCIIIAGPTAVGKTALAIKLAEHFSTQIISADSRQCYRELNIGVAKPSQEEMAGVTHYFINSFSVTENISAADYEKFALKSIAAIFEKNKVAILVGGTGLYIKAFCEGMDEIPETDVQLRKTVIENYQKGGLEWLQEQVKKLDPVYFTQGEIHNPQRMMRALEVKLSTGQSITSFQQQQKKERPFNIIKIGLELSRPDLYSRINKRVDNMISQGLEEEVKNLIPYKHFNALQTVGYRELFDYFDGKISREKALDLIKQNTRHYAKRQMTWFKKDTTIEWMDMHDEEKALRSIIKQCQKFI
jgi:tRNA dimethylallyltransferase